MAQQQATEPHEAPMRHLMAMLLTLSALALGCPAAGRQGNTSQARPEQAPAASGAASGAVVPGQTSPPLAPEQVAPERRVHAYVDGAHRVMDRDDARARGLTIVDLSDDWVPYIFWSQTPGKDDHKENEFLDTYVDLANDRIDVDGVALRRGEHNYFEVYGIPPSLSVLRERFVADEQKSCFRELELGPLKQHYFGPLKIADPAGSQREQKHYAAAEAAYRQALRAARVRTLEELLAVPAHRKVAEEYQRAEWRHHALLTLQKRLVCEEMFAGRAPKVKPGVVDYATREALKQFERKHNIYGWGMVFQETAEALGRTPLENNYESFKRVLTERVVSAAQILEDGSFGRATYKTRAGKVEPVRNLVEEFTQAMLQQMGLTTPEQALAFMQQHSEEEFARFFVAVKLPPLPEYYSENMDLSVVVDRGDVWYDLPFDEKGRPKAQPRSRMPQFMFYTSYAGQKIPLVRWRTTIGGWQPEMRNDEEYYKYKSSDVGPRIWRNIIAGPVWIPPKNTPSRDMIKVRPVRSRVEPIVSHQGFGPGYASAYGLVAAFHVTKEGNDNQVRTHGSVNYMSIQGKYSHGCHRLYNYRAVRLFSFVLAHRPFVRKGQTRLAYNQRFEHLGEEFQMDLTTRGYYYEMTPPVPVNVLEGHIRGERQEPIEEYVKKPTVVYQDDIAAGTQNPRKSSTSSAPRIKAKKPKTLMTEEQNL